MKMNKPEDMPKVSISNFLFRKTIIFQTTKTFKSDNKNLDDLDDKIIPEDYITVNQNPDFKDELKYQNEKNKKQIFI